MTSVCVHGLGYVGLPTAAMFANDGHDVTGVDVDSEHLDRLRAGGATFEEPDLDEFVDRAISSGRLTFQERADSCDYHLICVQTPFDAEAGEADLSSVREAAGAIEPLLESGDTIVLESTVPPGTTSGVLKAALERGGQVAGRDFNLAYCPETVLPGSILEEIRRNDRIVGGIDERSTAAAASLFSPTTEGTVHRAPNATVAEFAKLAQNTFRDANVAFANELAKVARDYGIRPRSAIALANTHPRVSLHQPGPGVGGHCLPVDPLYLGHDSGSLDLVTHARAINDGMPDYVVDVLAAGLGGLDGRRIAVFGVAYKGNVADARNSPGLHLARRLADRAPSAGQEDGGVAVRLHDPHVDGADVDADLVPFAAALDGADALVFATDHDEFAALSPADVNAHMRGGLIVDAKGLLDVDAWRRDGFDVEQI